MSPKNYLERYRKLRSELSNRVAELKMIEWEIYAPGGIDYSKDRIDSTPSSDQMLSLIMRKQMRTEELSSRINYIELTLKAIEEEVNAVSDAKNSRLLHLRYIEGYKWENIADIMSKEFNFFYSIDHTKGKMHRKALRDFWSKKETKEHSMSHLCVL